MRLTLRLSERGTEAAQTRVLETGRLSIGRGPDNDWVLLDPDRTLSKQHCFVDASDGQYRLTDVSTNGVFMAGSAQALGRGHSCVLDHGDNFAIGPYRIIAEIEGQDQAAGLSMPVAPEDIYPAEVSPSPITPAYAAPWLTDIPTGEFGPGRRAAPLGWEAPPDPARFAASGVLQARDPLDPRSSNGYAPNQFSQEAEHLAAASTVMRVPQAQLVLPADWNEADALVSVDAVEDTAPVLSPPELPADWIAGERAPEPEAFAVEGQAFLPSDWAPEPGVDEPKPPVVSQPMPMPVMRERAPPAHAPQAAADDLATPAATGGSSQSALIAAFLEGAGLPAHTLADTDAEEIFRDIGRMVRAAVDGVRDILSTRALVKSEFRVEQTVLRRSDNNAMKFAPDAQRCLAAMVGAAPPGFLPGSAAMRQSMDDIKIHELALVASINSVFADLSKQLDPETIMARARQETGLTTMLPYAREVRCWAIYNETHALLQDSGAHNTGGSLLAPVAQAYARQLRRS